MAASTYTVKSGDNLWNISKALLGGNATDSEILQKVNTLASINKLNNPDLIYVGQVLKLDNSGGSTDKETEDDKMVTIKHFGIQADSNNTLFVTWTWSRTSETEEYEVRWDYYTNNLLWFGGTSTTSTTKDKWHTYSIPANATQVRVRIRPMSKTYTDNNKEKTYFNGQWCGWKTHVVEFKPSAPNIPSVEVKGLDLTTEVSNLKDDPTIVQFEVIKGNTTTVKKEKVSVNTGVASYTCKVTAGDVYKVRCRAHKDGVWSDWTDYSPNQESAPAPPSGFTKCEAGEDGPNGPTIVLEWPAVVSLNNDVQYEIEYTKVKTHFDTTNDTTSIPNITTTAWTITSGLDDGTEYFFRIRSTKGVDNVSAWSEISSCILGKAPAPPTTWSSTTTAIVGEPLYLYWMHNSEDGSSLTYSYIKVYELIHDDDNNAVWSLILDHSINHADDDEESTSGYYEFNTSGYPEGTKLQWTVETAGIAKIRSDPSVARTIDIYAQPSLEMTLKNSSGSVFDELDVFPFTVSAVPYPATQSPVWYHLEVTSDQVYETVDNFGNVKMVNAGEVIYSKHFDISTSLNTSISAGDIRLENSMSYTVTCTVSMNSGLTATASRQFTVSWASNVYKPNASIGIDEDTLSAYITPVCETHSIVYYKVNRTGSSYYSYVVDENTTYESVNRACTYTIYTENGETKRKISVLPAVGETITHEQVYNGVTPNGENVLYCERNVATRVTDVTLAVYRREFDGTFTELYSGLDGAESKTITDPHPSLDYARYRIVATSKSTGSVSYYDPPGYRVGCKSIVIQWDEAWSTFDTFGNEDELEQPPWSGSMLKLPYNIDVSNKYSPDVALIEYIGRKHPVGYYGTQLGESATWSVEIEKSDIDTLYALRRLSIWMGNVYVREPSGSGYWAHVKVSFGQTHCETTIPVSFDVTRVEGGA